MVAAGFTLALIAQFESKTVTNVIHFIQYTLIDHPFSEIHFNFDHFTCEDVLISLHQNFNSIKGYFYLYMPFVSKIDNCNQIINQLRENPFFKAIRFVPYYLSINVFRELSESDSISFPYYSDGFSYDKIRICLSNIALYDREDDFALSDFSLNGFGYIKSEDFLNYTKERIQIYFENTIKYCDFDDLHLIKPDLYVHDTMRLLYLDDDKLKKVSEVLDDSNLYLIGDNEKFECKKISALNEDKKVHNYLSYIAHSIALMTRNTNIIRLKFNQMVAAFEACSIFSKKNNDDSKKGIVFQVHTGEGKSYIIQTIAAAQALMGKTVHIATSNIVLANRDYHDSYEFFNNLGLKSCVLLHKSELPKFDKEENDDDDTEDNFHYQKELYPDTFFGNELFENPSGMNIDVCGVGLKLKNKQTANIIFSTFVNFESFFLRLMEMNPKLISKYFQNCILLIDEADSILIDELTNGTILSRPMNTNGKEILIEIYRLKQKEHLSAAETLNEIKSKWPKCTDINIDDINTMYKEIDLVETNEFQNGKKYCVESIMIDKKKDENKIIKLFNTVSNIKEIINEKFEDIKGKAKTKVKEGYKRLKTLSHIKPVNQDQTNADTINHTLGEKSKSESNIEPCFKYGLSKEEKEENQIIKVNYIVPFDYDNKGILEPNKEFNGFIQQFIAIKERFSNPIEYKNMFIKDVSMSYLYVSHPLFVKYYSGVCGLTGTIGGSYEKKIFSEQYNLETLKIPRCVPNKRVDIPITLCQNFKVRNNRIVEEVKQFNAKGIPVLVIFLHLNEISIVQRMLTKLGFNVNVFDGKDQSKPDFVGGLKGAISLGTNVCGRGTDIKNPEKPLHVIISYYTSNVRVMQQAYGRTGRKGTYGTVHIVCTKKQYYEPPEVVKDNNLNHILDDFALKNKLQIEFIESFRKNREWIFEPITKTPKLDHDTIGQLRNARVNINRIVAYNYKFPLCLSVDTFLMIQAQKIFSLYNCPNSKFTWIIFQRYIREMIFESWSLFNDKTERYFFNNNNNNDESDFLDKEYKKLLEKICNYIPNDSNFGMVETFMHIYNKVADYWHEKIYKFIPAKYSCIPFKQTNTNRFLSFNVGFKPYNLLNESGARIGETGDDFQEPDFITDPEIKYERENQKKGDLVSFISLSITEAIDSVFKKVCTEINDIIGSLIGVKFFIRRTLGGCEFGLCFDLDIKNDDIEFDKVNCLVDRDPLLVFTISVRSAAPLLAGVLIFGLVYLASIAATIAEFVSGFAAEKLTVELLKKTVGHLIKQMIVDNLGEQIASVCTKIIGFLNSKLVVMIEKINLFNEKIAEVFNCLSRIIDTAEFENSGEKIYDSFKEKIQVSIKSQIASGLFSEKIPVAHFIKIGITLILCLAAFLINFNNHRNALKFGSNESKEEKVAAIYDKNHSNEKKIDELIKKNKDAYNDKDHIPLSND